MTAEEETGPDEMAPLTIEADQVRQFIELLVLIGNGMRRSADTSGDILRGSLVALRRQDMQIEALRTFFATLNETFGVTAEHLRYTALDPELLKVYEARSAAARSKAKV